MIKVRATYGFTEWVNHFASARHCQLITNQNGNGGMYKLTSYCDTKKEKASLRLQFPSNHVHPKEAN